MSRQGSASPQLFAGEYQEVQQTQTNQGAIGSTAPTAAEPVGTLNIPSNSQDGSARNSQEGGSQRGSVNGGAAAGVGAGVFEENEIMIDVQEIASTARDSFEQMDSQGQQTVGADSTGNRLALVIYDPQNNKQEGVNNKEERKKKIAKMIGAALAGGVSGAAAWFASKNYEANKEEGKDFKHDPAFWVSAAFSACTALASAGLLYSASSKKAANNTSTVAVDGIQFSARTGANNQRYIEAPEGLNSERDQLGGHTSSASLINLAQPGRSILNQERRVKSEGDLDPNRDSNIETWKGAEASQNQEAAQNEEEAFVGSLTAATQPLASGTPSVASNTSAQTGKGNDFGITPSLSTTQEPESNQQIEAIGNITPRNLEVGYGDGAAADRSQGSGIWKVEAAAGATGSRRSSAESVAGSKTRSADLNESQEPILREAGAKSEGSEENRGVFNRIATSAARVVAGVRRPQTKGKGGSGRS